MQSGSLRERISILKPSTAANGQGGRTTTWVDLVTGSATSLTRLSAAVRAVGTRERVQAAAMGATLSYTVTMRYRTDITPKMRVSWTPFKATAAKTLEIHGVTPLDAGRNTLTLDCAEVI